MYKLGIIGFGIVGKSVLAFLKRNHEQGVDQPFHDAAHDGAAIDIQIWDKRHLDQQEQALAVAHGATIVDVEHVDLPTFIESHDYLVASPGVDLSTYVGAERKVISELDFFASFYKKPVIAVTGSLGKTTVTKLIGSLGGMLPLRVSEGGYLRPAVGGNVGVGMLDLVSRGDDNDCAVLELSSFQLEFNHKFAPDIAVWTNLYSNHLDRHKTLENYFNAKFNMLRLQRSDHISIFSSDLLLGPAHELFIQAMSQLHSRLIICSQRTLGEILPDFSWLRHALFFTCEEGMVTRSTVNHGHVIDLEPIIHKSQLPRVTFDSNRVQVIATLHAMKLDIKKLAQVLEAVQQTLLSDLQHRVRHCATVRGVTFYDDSKSTVAEATFAAAERLADSGRPMIIILGGLGKGADRSWLMPALEKLDNLKQVFCFGPECSVFPGARACDTLDDVMNAVDDIMLPGDLVLFSPSGSSFDFFKNYEHRGQMFEGLVKRLK